MPATSNFVELLKAEGTTGGTCLVTAWEKVAECIKSDAALSRIFVVFLTDCQCWDIAEATTKAQAIFEATAQQKRVMTSFFVHIVESAVEDSPAKRQMDMMPLVRAANGGCEDLQFADQRIPLLEVVKATDLVPTFRKIGDLVNVQTLGKFGFCLWSLFNCIVITSTCVLMRKSALEARLHMLKSHEKEWRLKSAEDCKEKRAYYEDQAERLQEVAKRVEAAARSVSRTGGE